MPVKVKIPRIQLKLDTKGRIEMARATLTILERQARDGVSADGSPFGQGVTKPRIDLHRTGRLFRDVVIFPSRLSWRAPYSGYVAAKFRFLAIAPQYLDE